jgi:hypothetical protein
MNTDYDILKGANKTFAKCMYSTEARLSTLLLHNEALLISMLGFNFPKSPVIKSL